MCVCNEVDKKLIYIHSNTFFHHNLAIPNINLHSHEKGDIFGKLNERFLIFLLPMKTGSIIINLIFCFKDFRFFGILCFRANLLRMINV